MVLKYMYLSPHIKLVISIQWGYFRYHLYASLETVFGIIMLRVINLLLSVVYELGTDKCIETSSN